MKKLLVLLMCLSIIVSCATEANIASQNLSKDSDEFRVIRRVTFYNGITDKCILTIEGRCSVDFFQNKFAVTVKTGSNEYKKHYLGRADNVFPIVEQLETSTLENYKYKMIIRPSALIPNIEVK